MTLALLSIASAAGLARADTALPPPEGPAWEMLPLPRVARATQYDAVLLDGSPVLRARSECAAGARIHRMPGVDLAATPWLSWRWRVDEAPDAGDPTTRAGDDFALRVYVVFDFDPTRASLAQRLRQRVGRALFGEALPGAALNYVWSARVPAGARWENPYTDASKMISLGGGTLGRFDAVAVDVRADAQALFGGEPGPVAGVAIMSDSDQSCSRATAYVAELRFTRERPAGVPAPAASRAAPAAATAPAAPAGTAP